MGAAGAAGVFFLFPGVLFLVSWCSFFHVLMFFQLISGVFSSISFPFLVFLYFILTLNQKVEQHYFKQGDRVLIKNLTDQSGNHITGLTSKFYDYIETGAYIHSKADSTYTNQVFVHFPVDGYQNLNANANDIDKYLYQSSKNNDINTDAHGFIMNMSKQHSLVIEINEKVFNSDTTINSEIV